MSTIKGCEDKEFDSVTFTDYGSMPESIATVTFAHCRAVHKPTNIGVGNRIEERSDMPAGRLVRLRRVGPAVQRKYTHRAGHASLLASESIDEAPTIPRSKRLLRFLQQLKATMSGEARSAAAQESSKSI